MKVYLKVEGYREAVERVEFFFNFIFFFDIKMIRKTI